MNTQKKKMDLVGALAGPGAIACLLIGVFGSMLFKSGLVLLWGALIAGALGLGIPCAGLLLPTKKNKLGNHATK